MKGIDFPPLFYCPLCKKLHELKYSYKDVPICGCPEAEDGKLYTFNDGQLESVVEVSKKEK